MQSSGPILRGSSSSALCQSAGIRATFPRGDGRTETLRSQSNQAWMPSRTKASEYLTASFTAAPIPLDTRALRALKRSPLALDFYGLLTYRAFVASRKGVAQYVTWEDLRRQFGADYSSPKDFRRRSPPPW